MVETVMGNPIKMIFNLFRRLGNFILYKFIEKTEDNKISSAKLFNLICKQYGNKVNIFLADNKYKIWDKKILKKFLKESQVDKIKYISEKTDCDNYSYMLLGEAHRGDNPALGIVWILTKKYGHALNIWYNPADNKLYFVEPQSDRIFLKKEKYPSAKVYLIVI